MIHDRSDNLLTTVCKSTSGRGDMIFHSWCFGEVLSVHGTDVGEMAGHSSQHSQQLLAAFQETLQSSLVESPSDLCPPDLCPSDLCLPDLCPSDLSAHTSAVAGSGVRARPTALTPICHPCSHLSAD